MSVEKTFGSMSERTYAALKWVVMLVLPAIAAFYLGLAKLWGLPYAPEIVSTVAAITALLGAWLGISSAQYHKSTGNVSSDGIADAFWMLSDRAYSVLKWVTMLIFPATGALYFTMAKTWSLPYPTEIVGTIAALAVFLGVILGLGRITLKNKPNFLNLNTKTYDTMKWMVVQVLPSVSTAYLAVGKMWGLPYITEVAATIAALSLFFGVVLGISTANYKANRAVN